ncbi:MAG: hypothetical protein NW226_17450 [Microscillaceae bacterium]|nr:hypothetical protein [Microscillaceae bacterium]
MMNKEKFENWKNRFLNEASPEEFSILKGLLENNQNTDQLDQVKKIKAFDDYFNRIEGERWENNLDLSSKEKGELKAYFKKIDRKMSRKPGFRGWIPLLIGTMGGAAASFMIISMINTDNSAKLSSEPLTENIDYFKDNSSLEHLISSNSNIMGNSEALKVLSPKTEGNHSEQIVFQWKYEGTGKLELEIFNNQNESLTRGMRIILPHLAQELIINTTSLEPGLYYWKITRNNELVDINKFLIEAD